MKIRKIRPYWRVCMGGLGWGLLSLWVPLTFPLEQFLYPSLSLSGILRLFLPEMLAGFAVVALLDRYVSRTQEQKVRRIAGAALCLLSAGMPLAGTSPFVLHGGLFISCLVLSALVYPVAREMESSRQALTVFFWMLLTCAVGMALGTAFLTVWRSFVWLRTVSALILAAGGVSLLAKRTVIARREPGESPGTGVILEKSFAPASISFICLLVSFFNILQVMREAAALTPPALNAAVGLLAGMVYMGRRMVDANRPWQSVYTAFGCFALGALCRQLSLSGVYAVYLPLFFYVAAAGAAAGLFVYLLYGRVSVYNRAFVVGLAFLFCLWLTQMVLHVGVLSAFGAINIHPAIEPLLSALVFVAGPLLFAPFIRPDESGLSGGPDSPQSSETTGDPVCAGARASYVAQFTTAEIKVYELILRGYTNQQIADALFISINTVKFHVKNILAKAGVDKRYQLR